MTTEEQIGFFSTLKDDLTTNFIRQERGILELHSKMDELMMQTRLLADTFPVEPSSLLGSIKSDSKHQFTYFPTANLSISQLLWIHRLITDGTRIPYAQRGRFRSVAVWIGAPGKKPEEARFIPSPPEKIYPLTEQLLEQWQKTYPSLIHASAERVIEELSAFHHDFLSIHPFLDANGRVAMAILKQQALELLNRYITAKFTMIACIEQIKEI